MVVSGIKSLLFLTLLFPPLIYLQRILQREIQSVFLLLTRQPEVSMALFSLMFLPGVILHETSHYLMARILGVKTGRFSLIPKRVDNGRIQLGYVETAETDIIRDSLIGAAPLIAGSIFVAFIGASKMGVNTLWVSLSQGEAETVRQALETIFAQPDFWLWFYLTFTISSTMMPSPADRKAWLPLLAIIAVIFGLVLLLGAGPWIATHFGMITMAALNAMIIVFAITVVVHLILYPPVWFIRKIISRVTGYQVV